MREIEYAVVSHPGKVPRDIMRTLDFVFISVGDNKYDVHKNRFNGVNYKGVSWTYCQLLMNESKKR